MPQRLVVFHDFDADPADVESLTQTVTTVAPGEFDVLASNEFDSNLLSEEDVIVFCGRECAQRFMGGGVKITEEAGNVRAFEIEEQGGEKRAFKALLQLSPGYVRKQNQLKGGSSEKAVRLYLDVWEQAAKMCDGSVVEEPPTRMLKGEKEAIGFLEELLCSSVKDIAYDYETWGDVDALRPELCREFKIVSINVAYRDPETREIVATAFLFDRPHMASPALETTWKKVLKAKSVTAHFIRYEHKCNIKRLRMTVPGKDTLLMLHALDELADGSLDRVMVRCGLHWGAFKTKYSETRKNPMFAPVPELLRYGGLDGYATLECGEILEEELVREGLTHIARQDEDFCYHLAFQEMDGLQVDPAAVVKQREKAGREAETVMAEFRQLPVVKKVEAWAKDNIKSYRGKKEAVFNPKSTPMMHRLVVDELKLKPITKKKKGVESITFDSDALEKLAAGHKSLRRLNDYRSAKAMETYLSKWTAFIGPKGAVHTSYNQHIVVTGRLSSTNPPLQNIPKDHEIRTVFVSRFPGGYLLNADYAQQEPRLIAGWSGDVKLKEAINGGLDLHAFVAGQIYDMPYEDVGRESKERDVGKRMNLGIAYGQTEFGLSAKTGLSIDAARDLLARYDRMFPDITTWRMGFHKQAMMYGYVSDLFGARRHLPDAQSDNKWERERALRQAGNFPIQGTAYRFTQIAVGVLRELFNQHLPKMAYVVGQVHDSIIVDCHPDAVGEALTLTEEAMLIHNTMWWWKDRGCPMKVDLKVGRNLYKMQKVA